MDFFCVENKFFLLPEKNQNFRKFAWKTRYSFVKLPEKIEIFGKFACRNRKFLTRFHDPPDFKPDLRRCCYPSLDFSVASSEITFPKLQNSLTCSIISSANTIFIADSDPLLSQLSRHLLF